MLKAFIDWLGTWLLGAQPQPVGPIIQPSAEDACEPAAAAMPTPLPPVRVRSPRQNHIARIIAAFDCAHPVRQRKDLHGREDKLDRLFDAVLFNRQHAIIHGARGSGKTSLAQVFGDYADQQSAVVIYAACEPMTSFAELMRPYFAFIPDSCVPFSEKAHFERDKQALANDFGPRELVDFLSRLSPERQIIMILDEFDRVENPLIDHQVATLMKLLSDAQVPVQLLVVGIAHTLDDLIDCHPSLRRHLVPIPIGRISQQDVMKLIEAGSKIARIDFDDLVKARIVALACGSPYHAQLFCYVSAIEAVKHHREAVDTDTFHAGLRRACEGWGMLNERDHEHFTVLAGGRPADVARVELGAREAAAKDGLSPDAATAQLLGEALTPVGGEGRAVFRDSTAPQFLLAMIALERVRASEEANETDPSSMADDAEEPPLPIAI